MPPPHDGAPLPHLSTRPAASLLLLIPLHLPPNLIALRPPFPHLPARSVPLSVSPPSPPSPSHSHSPLYLFFPSISVRIWQSPKHISIHLVFWAGKSGGGVEEGGMKKYEKQFNNNNDADDKINYAQGWRMRGEKKE